MGLIVSGNLGELPVGDFDMGRGVLPFPHLHTYQFLFIFSSEREVQSFWEVLLTPLSELDPPVPWNILFKHLLNIILVGVAPGDRLHI